MFVEPPLVEGTLRKGFSVLPRVRPGFCRALYVLFVVSEVHPFTDGNGRVSRVMMNAELSSVGQARIVIPNVYRNEYLSGLRRASAEGATSALWRASSPTRGGGQRRCPGRSGPPPKANCTPPTHSSTP